MRQSAMANKTFHLHLRLDEDTAETLRGLAQARGETLSNLVRRVLENYRPFANEKPPHGK